MIIVIAELNTLPFADSYSLSLLSISFILFTLCTLRRAARQSSIWHRIIASCLRQVIQEHLHQLRNQHMVVIAIYIIIIIKNCVLHFLKESVREADKPLQAIIVFTMLCHHKNCNQLSKKESEASVILLAFHSLQGIFHSIFVTSAL
jgi:hypothetical protein